MNIPKGWQISHEVPLNGAESLFPSKYIDENGCETSIPTEWLIIKTVAGESREGRQTHDANRIEVDGIRFATNGSNLIMRIVPGYFSYWVPKAHAQGHDICFYCGESNGPNGELRQGHDCWRCGGN